MIERQFWEVVRRVWTVQVLPEAQAVKAGSGDRSTHDSSEKPWEVEAIPFDMVDFDEAVQAAFHGGNIPLKPGAVTEKQLETPKTERPHLDTEMFDSLLRKQSIPNYVDACKLLKKCELPEDMEERYVALIQRLPVLQEAIVKFESVYQAEMTPFYEYYVPETLQLTATYLEYMNAGIGEEILRETENEVLEAADKLLTAVNDKIDEIYKFASMEIKAKAKALESLMSQDGYVESDFKIK